MVVIKVFIIIITSLSFSYGNEKQVGPDPWNYVAPVKNGINENVPPDLKVSSKKTDCNYGTGEWFFKRALAIILKGGSIKENEDASVNVMVQMEFSHQHWATLQEYISTSNTLSDDMYRRVIGYLEEAIIEPAISEKIVVAWTEYIYKYLVGYKVYLTWTCGVATAIISLLYLWTYIRRHWIIILFVFLYFYEVLISYKEAEQQELNMFLSAISKCKWYFWTSSCEAPQPDPLIFLKHMNPGKIAIRMFTNCLCEPMVSISSTVKVMVQGITDGLWFPLDRIMYGLILVIFNALLIFLLIVIIFNYILNTAFNINFLGLINIGVLRKNRRFVENTNDKQSQNLSHDRISGDTLNRILDVVSHALTNTHGKNPTTDGNRQLCEKNCHGVKRSASTGRLPILASEFPIKFDKKEKNVNINGSGDAR